MAQEASEILRGGRVILLAPRGFNVGTLKGLGGIRQGFDPFSGPGCVGPRLRFSRLHTIRSPVAAFSDGWESHFKSPKSSQQRAGSVPDSPRPELGSAWHTLRPGGAVWRSGENSDPRSAFPSLVNCPIDGQPCLRSVHCLARLGRSKSRKIAEIEPRCVYCLSAKRASLARFLHHSEVKAAALCTDRGRRGGVASGDAHRTQHSTRSRSGPKEAGTRPARSVSWEEVRIDEED